jgi:ABC-type microcin C transport system duplicated ATPase subunit YejF
MEYVTQNQSLFLSRKFAKELNISYLLFSHSEIATLLASKLLVLQVGWTVSTEEKTLKRIRAEPRCSLILAELSLLYMVNSKRRGKCSKILQAKRLNIQVGMHRIACKALRMSLRSHTTP